MAAINSLGIGSGVLTADIIDQLREADEFRIIKPLENKITLANQKEDAYKLLSSLMTTFKSSTSALDGDNLYLSRAVTGNTDAVTVTAESGSDVQSFNISNVSKAEKDVWNSEIVANEDTAFQSAAGTFSISIDGVADPYDIVYTATSTLAEIKDQINELAGTQITASILEVGANQFELVITADDVNKAITFSDSNVPVQQVDTITLADTTLEAGDEFSLTINGFEAKYTAILGDTVDTVNDALKTIMDAHDFGSGSGNDFTISASASGAQTITAVNAGIPFTSSAAVLNDSSATATMSSAQTTEVGSLAATLNLNNIQQAKAATFDYNGIPITRSSNEISDLINGVTINLNQNQAVEDTASIDIAQNNTSISSEISLFVNGYNSLVTNLQDMTKSDRETGAVGIFNGESFVKGISRDLLSLITQVDGNGNSLMDYGIDIDRDGVMSLDNDVFAKKYVEDAEAMELFFSGNADTDGVFTRLNDKMTNYTGYNKLLSNFSDQLADSKDSLVAQHEKQKASLDARYEIMTKRFSAYDAIISRINSQFSSLKMMIDAEANKN